tara:strand:- start:3565 stop:3933 length:369 start_codon:yes stop_codon:yes gene_type:complete
MSMSGIAPSLPIQLDSDGGYLLLRTLKDVARQNLKMVVLTDPGERMMDPSFGVGVRRLLFENENSDVANISSRIVSQAKKYVSWVAIENIDIDNSDNLLVIKIHYYIPAIGSSRDLLTISVN